MNEERQDDQENYRTEYKEVTANHRLFIGLRFITAGFTATIQSALLTFYGQTLQKTPPQIYIIMIPVLGIVSMLAIFAVEQRNIQLFRVMIKRGKELEFNMGLVNGQLARISEISPPKGLKRIITHTWGIRLVYLLFLAMWTYLCILNLFNR